jgi:hypothetical protein
VSCVVIRTKGRRCPGSQPAPSRSREQFGAFGLFPCASQRRLLLVNDGLGELYGLVGSRLCARTEVAHDDVMGQTDADETLAHDVHSHAFVEVEGGVTSVGPEDVEPPAGEEV